MSLLASIRKTLAVTAAVTAITALPTQAARKIKLPDVRPGTPPLLVQDAVLTDVYHNKDNSYVLLRFNVMSGTANAESSSETNQDPGSSLLGWATNQFAVSLRFNDGVYAGIAVEDQERVAGYNADVVARRAAELHFPEQMLRRIVMAHEGKHLDDYSKYPLANYNPTDCSCDPKERPCRESPLSTEGLNFPKNENNERITFAQQSEKTLILMEGRAVCAEYEAFKEEVNKAIALLKNHDGVIEKLNKEREKYSKWLEKAKAEHSPNAAVYEQEVQDKDNQIQAMEALYAEVLPYGLEYFEQMNPNKKLKKPKGDKDAPGNMAEDFFTKYLLGETKIEGTTTTYKEAYLKCRNLKRQGADEMKTLHDGLKALTVECLISMYPNPMGFNHSLVKNKVEEHVIHGRPVCLKCRFRDPLGPKCGRSWCANYGKTAREYVPQEGDYTPENNQDPFRILTDKDPDPDPEMYGPELPNPYKTEAIGEEEEETAS